MKAVIEPVIDLINRMIGLIKTMPQPQAPLPFSTSLQTEYVFEIKRFKPYRPCLFASSIGRLRAQKLVMLCF
jgi:hypothetical protein